MNAILSLVTMRDGMTLPVWLVLFVAPALLWGVVLLGLRLSPLRQWRQRLSEPFAALVTGMVMMISAVMLLRLVVGGLALTTLTDLWVVRQFYPIRIAAPNYGVVAGLPGFVLLLVVAFQWPRLAAWLARGGNRFMAFWLMAVVVLVASGSITGGPLSGLAGIYAAPEQAHDAALAHWSPAFFREHAQRIEGTLTPAYQASHTATHPAFNLLVYGLLQQVGALGMGLLTITLFALLLPLMARQLADRVEPAKLPALAMLVLATTGYLIYGPSSDDALNYLAWAGALLLAQRGIERRQPLWLCAAAVVIVLACNLNYGSIVLLAGVFAFTTGRRLGELASYLREQAWSVVALLAGALLLFAALAWFTGVDIVSGILLVLRYEHEYVFRALVLTDPIRAVNDRLMVIADFVVFAGPPLLTTWILAGRQATGRVAQWSIAGTAFVVLLLYILFTSPGAGESGRGWGGLYLCWWLGGGLAVARRWDLPTLNRMVQVALGYAAVLQLVVDFGW